MTVGSITLAPDLQVSRLGFGGMAISHIYGPTDPAQAVATLHRALDLGITFIDTADVYGEPRPGTNGPAGTNEELIATVLKDRRNEVQLATKFGITGAVGDEAPATRGDREYVRASCEASLRRLGVNVIDLYYLHRRELGRPITETVAAMAELVAEGKVRHLGLSEVTAAELREACEVHPIAAVQSEWSLWSRDVEAHVVPAAIELGVGFVPYSPLGRGFLTGSLTKEAVTSGVLAKHRRFTDHFDANQQVVAEVGAVAEGLGCTSAQIALAWLFAKGAQLGLPVVPIPGTKNPARLAENAASITVELSATDVQRLDQVAALAQGDRNFDFAPQDWISSGRE